MSAFGDFLYTLRKEKGMTQVELADALGVTNKAVSKWETGESMPETSQLLPLSRIFGVSVDELLDGKRAPKEDMLDGKRAPYEDMREGKRASQEDMYSGKHSSQETVRDGSAFYYERKYDENTKSDFYEDSGINGDAGADRYERPSQADMIRRHLFTRGKDEHSSVLSKLAGAVCSSLVLIGVIVFFIVGFAANGWHPYWVIIPCFALASGIAGIIFDLCDKNKRAEKRARGENPYVGAACGILMLVCVISYLLLGALANLWHPCWIIPAAGGIICGIIAPIGVALDELNKNKNDKDDDK